MSTTESSRSLVSHIVKAVQKVVGKESAPLHEPNFDGNEWRYIKECLDSNYVSSVGHFVSQFESKLAHYTGAKYAISVVNGTSALHVALKLAGVQSNDEVLVPALTFIATANAVTFCGAFPHLVDIEETTLGIDPDKLRDYLKESTFEKHGQLINKNTNRIISALVPMHTFGHPSNIDGLTEVANEFNLAVVEDAAESLGSFYKGRHTGTFGTLGTLSFNGNKIVTTGGGGAILTDDSNLAARAKQLTTTAKQVHPWEFIHDEVGYNYRMPNINAALGCAQLELLDDKVKKKRALYSEYKKQLASIAEVSIFSEPKESRSNYWLQTLLLNKDHEHLKEHILKASNELGIGTRSAWRPLNEQAPYRSAPSMDLSIAKSLYNRIVSLPSSPQLSESST